MENNGQLRRILIATVISFAFFVAYDYFVLTPQQKAASQLVEQNKTTVKTVSNTNNAADKISKKANNENVTTIATVSAKNFQIKIDSLGRISSFKLKQTKFNTENGKHLELVNDKLPKPLEIRFENKVLNKLAFEKPVKADKTEITLNDKPQTLTLTQNLNDKEIVTKIITFYPDGHYDVKVKLTNPAIYYITPGYRPKVAVDKLTIHGLVVKKSDGTLSIIEDGDAVNETIDNAIITAGFDRYYTTLLFSKKPYSVIVVPDNEENPVAFIKADDNREFIGYIGPKFVDTLAAIDKELVDVVQYGVGTFFAKNLFFLLDWFYKLVGNWGVAIILLVVLVRLVLFPLTYKGMVSMYKLKELAPKMKEIQQKYKKDPQKLQMHMMKLYKEHGANPLGGCLPLILQIPVFYGIYKLLLYAIELKGASFLWIKDLSVMDPYFILPVLMGVSMYIHQKLTPTNFQDPMQEKIFKFLPLIFTFMMATFPAGLVLYWTVNNILSIAQQWLINRIMASKAKK
ncbi:inner membrane protein OxaA [Nautilia profundicola AmH]|uniref:Membrane protein insertase YidC n=1 Tax=Nautilia profundicola (strain ATCC BAA-1463 / DSM 18972 / AmH) TaxID=598659 RepID=B9L9D7_NAUPA|nr:membrane protein insertase YidC [Nautilia profundicola]ACM92785.1 inner membrane protein OxaA [Nautilia profundicola AmH]